MRDKLADVLVRWKNWTLVIAVLIALASFPLSRQLDRDWRIESMFPPGDPLVASYRKLQERFGGNDICLAVYRDPGLWDPSGVGLERLESVSRRLAQVEGVHSVLSLAELHSILQKLRSPMHLFSATRPTPPLLDPNDELAQALASVFEGYTHRRSSDYVAVACLLEPTADDKAAQRGPSNYESTLDALRNVMRAVPAPASQGFVTGEPVLVAEGFRMVERDGWRLGIVSSVLVSIVLLVCFRSLRWTLIPLVVVHWSLLVTQAVLVLVNLELTMISSTLTAIVTVIGVATSMHLLLKYQRQRRHQASRSVAMRETLDAMLAPIFWACATDAIGFGSLMVASVGPVRDFGLMMAIGSFSVFVAIVLLVPGLALLGSIDADPRTPRIDASIRWTLRYVLATCLKRRKLGLALLGLLFVIATVGSLRMQVETDFTQNFKQDSPLMEGYQVIENELGGAGVWDIMLAAPRALTSDYLDQVLVLESKLEAIRVPDEPQALRLTKVLSIADAVAAAESGSLLSALPATLRVQGMQTAMPGFSQALLTSDADETGHRWLRIMLRSKEQTSAAAKSRLVAEVRSSLDAFTSTSEWQQFFSGAVPQSEVAGYHIMLGELVANVLADQWRCFALASLGIYSLMALATRSFVLGFAALVPNALPVLLVLGSMGWLGIQANMGVAMIAAVSLGLSIDSSIHYLLHYRQRLAEGASPQHALRSAQENVGLAVVLSTAALIAGFMSLCISEFVPNIVFGALASLTMLGGLIGNLVMLPLLIVNHPSAPHDRH